MQEVHPVFQVNEKPTRIPFDTGMLPSFRILMGGASNDRVDPTLTVVGVWENEWASEGSILAIELSPSLQRATLVGTASLGDADAFTLNFQSLFPFMGKACPSVLLSPLLVSPPRALLMYRDLFMTLDGGHCLLEGVRKTPNDPFRRVGRMFREEDGACQDRRLDGDEALELATHLLRPRVADLEWKVFLDVWDEAASARVKAGSNEPTLDFKGLIAVYDVLQSTCRLKWRRTVTRSSRAGSPRRGA